MLRTIVATLMPARHAARRRSWRSPLLGALVIAALCLSVFAGGAAAQRNARVLQRNLAELTGDAYTIVVGRVASVRAEPHPQFQGLQSVVVTLDVSEVWKGQAGKQFTFRLYVDDPIDQQTNLGYKVGQQVLLFMTQPSKYGFSSPAGLEQGRFRIVRDASGSLTVINGWTNRGLFGRMDQKAPNLKNQVSVAARQVLTTHRAGPISYESLKEIVSTLVAH